MLKGRKLKLLLGMVAGGYIIKNPECYDLIENNLILPLSHQLPPEFSHKCALWMIKLKIPPRNDLYKPNMLRTTVFGMHFDNPIGLAAGFDKDCEAVSGLQRLGFGFIEVGSVTPLPQAGNEQPRLFRLLEDKAIINRYGFPSKGADAAVGNLSPWSIPFVRVQVEQVPDYDQFKQFVKDSKDFITPPPPLEQEEFTQGYQKTFQIRSKFFQSLIESYLLPSTCKVGINLGINKTTNNPTNDYCIGIEKLGEFSDYIVINVSSPNTPGLRDLQRKSQLEKMLRHISRRVKNKNKASQDTACRAFLLKISPDLSDEYLKEVIEVVLNPSFGVGGIIVSNTTISRPDSLVNSNKNERGGLSGPPLKNLSTEMIKKVYRLTDGTIPIIGCGGVSSAEDAYEKIRAGASLIQLYTGLVYNGVGLVRRMKTDLCKLVGRDGFINIQMAVGADVPDVTNKTFQDIFKRFEQFHRSFIPLPPSPLLGSVLEPPKSGFHDESSSNNNSDSSVEENDKDNPLPEDD